MICRTWGLDWIRLGFGGLWGALGGLWGGFGEALGGLWGGLDLQQFPLCQNDQSRNRQCCVPAFSLDYISTTVVQSHVFWLWFNAWRRLCWSSCCWSYRSNFLWFLKQSGNHMHHWVFFSRWCDFKKGFSHTVCVCRNCRVDGWRDGCWDSYFSGSSLSLFT